MYLHAHGNIFHNSWHIGPHFVFRFPRHPYEVVVVHSKLPNEEKGFAKAASAPCINWIAYHFGWNKSSTFILLIYGLWRPESTLQTLGGVANGWLELLEPTQLHIQRIVQELKLNQIVPLVEVDVDCRRAADCKIYASGHV